MTDIKQISALQLQRRLNQGDSQPLLLDVREPWEFEKCHLANAQLIPMSEMAARWQELDNTRETVVLCHHGMRSQQLIIFLISKGFEHLINLSGGLDAWSQYMDPSIPRY